MKAVSSSSGDNLMSPYNKTSDDGSSTGNETSEAFCFTMSFSYYKLVMLSDVYSHEYFNPSI